MRFTLIDRIIELQPGDSIRAVKALSIAEEYLQDHFPLFPVMPGVMMLESMYQASAWLLYKSEEFAHSVMMLKEARNVKYADFVEPGQLLIVEAKVFKEEGNITTLKTQGLVSGKVAVSARLLVEKYNLADRHPERAATDPVIRRQMAEEFKVLYQPT